ncbi:Protein of unknown function [Lactobacillus helveticus CIRM-BIA 953]|jgi:hypothetical protein
MNGT